MKIVYAALPLGQGREGQSLASSSGVDRTAGLSLARAACSVNAMLRIGGHLFETKIVLCTLWTHISDPQRHRDSVKIMMVLYETEGWASRSLGRQTSRRLISTSLEDGGTTTF